MRKILVVILLIAVLSVFVVGCSSSTETKTQCAEGQMLKNGVCVSDTQPKDIIKEDLSLEGTYTIDSQASMMTWHGEKIVGNAHTGTISVSEGNVVFDASQVSGEFVIDMTSMVEDEESDVMKHLKSEDFFYVEKYPTSKFVIKNIVEGMVTGDLTILDKTNEISFPVELTEEGDMLKAKAMFTIDRTKWGIKYSSESMLSEIGDKVIRDDITFGLDLVFNKN